MNYLSYLFSNAKIDESKQITYRVIIQSGNQTMILDTEQPVKSYYQLMNLVGKTTDIPLNQYPTTVKLVGDEKYTQQFTTHKSITEFLNQLD